MRIFNRALDTVVAALGVATLLLVNYQILCRFVLSISVPWTEEVSRLLFVWLAFLGAAIGVREGTLIVIDTVPAILGERRWRFFAPFVTIISLAVIVFMFAASIPLVRSVWPTTLATVDWISNGWAYLAFTVSFGLMIMYSVLPLLRGKTPPMRGPTP
jgi:TRAP-type C4-dicarboxylate transport system permease small subunit